MALTYCYVIVNYEISHNILLHITFSTLYAITKAKCMLHSHDGAGGFENQGNCTPAPDGVGNYP